MPLLHSEALSGLWMASDGSGGAVGIHVMLATVTPTELSTATNTPDSWEHLSLGVFQRRGSTFQFGDTNYFTDFSDTDRVSFEQGRLRLKFESRLVTIPSVDLDLEQQDQTWTDRLHRGQFDSVVTIKRPGADLSPIDPLVGTWQEHDSILSANFSCAHIAQQAPGTFIGWSDSIYVPGRVLYPPNISPPVTATNIYGQLVKVQLQDDNSIQLPLNAFSGICCPRNFTGKLAGDLITLRGTWLAGPNQFQREASWVRMSANSCRSPGG